MGKLTRKGISSGVSLQVTPHRGHKTLTPHISKEASLPTTLASPFVITSSLSSQISKPSTTFFSPIPMLADLVAAKKEKLKKSFDESKKQNLARISSGTPTKHKPLFSSTMVQQMTLKDLPVHSASTTLQGTQYGFSPPAEMAVDSEKPSSLSSPPTKEASESASFVFSPPLTRSAARRLRGGDTSVATTRGREREVSEPPPVSVVAAHKKRGRGRPRKSASATPERAGPVPEPVELVSPPSHPPTPSLIPTEPLRQHRRKTRAAKSSAQTAAGTGTRRSTRLLMGKK